MCVTEGCTVAKAVLCLAVLKWISPLMQWQHAEFWGRSHGKVMLTGLSGIGVSIKGFHSVYNHIIASMPVFCLLVQAREKNSMTNLAVVVKLDKTIISVPLQQTQKND